jgi:putative FmdB family regulatory protein
MDFPGLGKRERSIRDEGEIVPIYEYKCKSCGHFFERIMKVGEEAPTCPACAVDRPQRRIAAFRTNAWSSFLDRMEKQVGK